MRQTIVLEHTLALVKIDRTIDILLELSLNFKDEAPGRQGMMHIIHQGQDHPGQSPIVFLPMIDLYSGDKTCILSTLVFIYDLSTKHHALPITLVLHSTSLSIGKPQRSSLMHYRGAT